MCSNKQTKWYLESNFLQVVSNVMVVGDKRKYLTCLITLKVMMMIITIINLRVMMMIKNSIDDENRKEVPDMHAWLLNWAHDSWFQVTIDPTTLAPTDQLDPRALAWIESLGVKPKQTVQVIFLYFLCPSSRNQLMMTIFIDCKRKTFELIPKSRRPSSFNSDDSLSSTRTNWIFLLNRERKDWPSR